MNASYEHNIYTFLRTFVCRKKRRYENDDNRARPADILVSPQ